MTILTPDTRIVWTDVETFGLEDNDPLIEVAFAITNLDLDILAAESWLLWDFRSDAALIDLRRRCNAGDKGANIVNEMHGTSGLFEDARGQGAHPAVVELGIATWLQEHGVGGRKDPLAGSSVHFDRGMLHRQLPLVHDLFSHRDIDVSSFKETCRRYNPRMFAFMETDVWDPEKPKAHRALSDIEDTIAEYNWYLTNFVYVDAESAPYVGSNSKLA